MTQSSVPDRPPEGLPAGEPEPGQARVDRTVAPGSPPPASIPSPPGLKPPPSGPSSPSPLPPTRSAPRHESISPPATPAPSPPVPPPPAPTARTHPDAATPDTGRTAATAKAGSVGDVAAAPQEVTRWSVVSRLALVLPVLVGVLLVEGVFASRGRSGDVISLPAAGLALVLMWAGVAWALRSWVVLLLTFVPAIMVTLGAAMVGGLAPGAGAALLVVGLALIGAVIAFRVSAPAHRWNSGWSPSPRGASTAWPPPDLAPGAGADPMSDPMSDLLPGGHGAGPAGNATGPVGRWPFRPLDPLGAHFLSPPPVRGHEPEPQRPAPEWDTSRTDRGARDRLVAALCRRGGTTGPTLATLEEYFTGNGDPRSIAPGLRGAVPLSAFAAVLYRVRGNHAVSELLVQVEPLEAGTYPAGEWPAAGGIHLISTLGADQVDGLLTDLHPEPAIGPLPADALTSGARAPEGSGECAIWWA